jgi:hypothetical protein
MTPATLTLAEVLNLTADGFTSEKDIELQGPVVIAKSIVGGAIGDLSVLCHAVSAEGVDDEELGMMIIRIRERLEAAESILRRALPEVQEGSEVRQ